MKGNDQWKTFLDRSVQLGEFIPEPDDDRIVCRCEEVTKGEIRRAVHDGCLPLPKFGGICEQAWDCVKVRLVQSW